MSRKNITIDQFVKLYFKGLLKATYVVDYGWDWGYEKKWPPYVQTAYKEYCKNGTIPEDPVARFKRLKKK